MNIARVSTGAPRSLVPLAVGSAICAALAVLLVALTGGVVGVSSTSENSGSEPSARARADIPAEYLALYQQAAALAGIDWAILAAIGKVETNHGRSTLPGVQSGVNEYGCCAGPMQFNIRNGPPSTWDAYGSDADTDGATSPYQPADAIHAAARLLVASGAPADYRRAIYAYNHDPAYVEQVLATAHDYREQTQLATVGDATAFGVLANPRVQLTPLQRADLQSGVIDARVIRTLTAIGATRSILLSSLKSDHSPGTNHEAGRAFDIAAVNGEICTGTHTGQCGRLVLALAQIRGVDRSTELIYCFDADLLDPDVFARSDHCDHIHIGWD